jgi:hypothetical protein
MLYTWTASHENTSNIWRVSYGHLLYTKGFFEWFVRDCALWSSTPIPAELSSFLLYKQTPFIWWATLPCVRRTRRGSGLFMAYELVCLLLKLFRVDRKIL